MHLSRSQQGSSQASAFWCWMLGFAHRFSQDPYVPVTATSNFLTGISFSFLHQLQVSWNTCSIKLFYQLNTRSLKQTLLWGSSTVYIYLSALFHATDFRVTVPPFLQTQAHLTACASAWMLSRLPLSTHLHPKLQNAVWQACSLGVSGQGEEEEHTNSVTRTLTTPCVNHSDPAFHQTTRREACAWNLSCTPLSAPLWSLAMTIRTV